MASKSSRINVVKEVLIILRKHPIRLYNELFTRGIHLNLRLLPIRFRYSKFGALVCLDLVDDIVLTVEIYTKPHTVFTDTLDTYLTVAPFDAEMIKDTMLVSRSCCSILIREAVLSDAELYVPPLGEGVSVPIPHDGCRIGSTLTKPTFSAMVSYHITTSLVITGVVRVFFVFHPRLSLERITK